MLDTQRLLLHLTPHQLAAYTFSGNRLSAPTLFPVTEQGQASFALFLTGQRPVPCSLLADLPDESYRQDSIPYLVGRDRQAVIDRRLQQHFPGTPFRSATRIGREPDGRRDERLLLSALTHPEILDPWLNLIDAAGYPFSGVYSLPLVAKRLLKYAALDKGKCLLVSFQETGLRQSFYHNGELLFSRLASLQPVQQGQLKSTLASESKRVLNYLQAQHFISRQETLDTYVLATPGLADSILPPQRDPRLALQIIDPATVAAKAKLPLQSSEPASPELFLLLLCKRLPSQQFAPENHRLAFHLWQWKRWLRAASVAILAGGLLFAGRLEIIGQQMDVDTEHFNQRRQDIDQRYVVATSRYPALPLPLDRMRNLADQIDKLVAGRPPHAALTDLSHALDALPVIEIDQIDWQAARLLPSSRPESLVIEARVHDAQLVAHPRNMLAYIQAFSRELESGNRWQVTPVRMPFEFDPSKTLSGRAGDTRNGTDASFSLRITRRSAP